MKNKDITVLQEASIPKLILAKQIAFLQTKFIQAQFVQTINKLFEEYVPNTFWDEKHHMVELPCEKYFDERDIPTKAHLIQINKKLLEI